MLILFSLKFNCQHGVKNGHITAGWVGECCSELGTPSAIPKSDTKECFCWDILGMLLGVNGAKWRSWCGLEMVVISEGGEG